MDIEKRNRFILLLSAIFIIIFGYIVVRVMEPIWNVFPFMMTLAMISIALLFCSNKSIYLYLENASTKKRNLVIGIISTMIIIFSIVLHIIFFIKYGM